MIVYGIVDGLIDEYACV